MSEEPHTDASGNSPVGSRRDAAGGPAAGFDPARHRDELLAIIREVEAQVAPGETAPGPLAPSALERILRRHPRAGRGFFKRSEIIAGYRYLARERSFAIDEATFLARMQLRPVRSRSGVMPVTVLTRPHPCPGRCVFCPNDTRMPKSYLADEPGAQRAAQNRFDPYLQTWNRLVALDAIGHPTDKLELIVLGGTWSFYSEPYQIWFVKRVFDAMNDFGAEVDRRPGACADTREAAAHDFGALTRRPGETYNHRVSEHLRSIHGGRIDHAGESASWAELERAQLRNERAACRCVGLVVETRPDHVSRDEALRIRRLGGTKVQLGFQSLSDEILERNRRGHTTADTRRAMRVLRRAGFKVHAHWMPNLLGASPASDVEDFARLFGDPALRPDELKIYPCSLIESADLMTHYARGEWRPYTHDELLGVIVHALETVPRYCRVTRVIRDISSDDIVAGNKLTNFRQIAEAELARRGGRCVDIRSREIRERPFDAHTLRLARTEYATAVGTEVFLELVTSEDHIVGFLRLLLPAGPPPIRELTGCALVRELHVYGAAVEIGKRSAAGAQHRGLGQRLVDAARLAARERGFRALAVISAVGTRPYYRKLGFRDGPLYQHLDLA